MGGDRQRPSRGAPGARRPWPARHPLRNPLGRQRHGRGGHGRGGRGTGALDLRRIRRDGPGPHRYGDAAPAPRRNREAEGPLHAGPGRRAADRRRCHDGSGRGLGPGVDAHDRAPGCERLGAGRIQDVHHQRHPWGCLLRRRQDRCAGPEPPDLDVHRRERNAGVLRLPPAEEAWLAEQRHGGAALRRLQAACRPSAGRGEPGLPRRS